MATHNPQQSNKKWLCRIEGDEVGPLTSAQMKKLASTGVLKRDCLVQRVGDSTWTPAHKLKGLFKDSPSPKSRKPIKGSPFSLVELLITICITGGLLIAAVFVVNIAKQAQVATEPAASVELTDWKTGKWSRYTDPKGRFSCEVPPDWSVKTLEKRPQSELRVSYGGHDIRITVRETKVHEMYDGIRQEMTDGMSRSARNLGPDGKLGNVVWTTLAGSRALQIDLESQTRERFARTIKAKHDSYDHFVGMYVEPSSQKEELCDLFEEFRSRYGETD
ncbi:GYF domain-containing protein [Thalassoglobus sp.]|uniref:GYF domain-containing protein n=1 Tax=Thalassoglobus sp. TaxID=2795869 RepID=UPI003AA82744